eukprot:4730016-Alexandrium_andersonii.AAC.1
MVEPLPEQHCRARGECHHKLRAYGQCLADDGVVRHCTTGQLADVGSRARGTGLLASILAAVASSEREAVIGGLSRLAS